MFTPYIYIFARSDGTCLHHQVCRPPSSSSSSSSSSSATQNSQTSPPHNITSHKIWPIIQNFIGLSRDIDGGTLRRLVFRSPADYAPTVKKFNSVNQQTPNPTPPIVMHVFHDARFVVTVIQYLLNYSIFQHSAQSSSAFTIADFCASIHNFLTNEYSTYITHSGANSDQHNEQNVLTLKKLIQQSKLSQMITNTMNLVQLSLDNKHQTTLRMSI